MEQRLKKRKRKEEMARGPTWRRIVTVVGKHGIIRLGTVSIPVGSRSCYWETTTSLSLLLLPLAELGEVVGGKLNEIRRPLHQADDGEIQHQLLQLAGDLISITTAATASVTWHDPRRRSSSSSSSSFSATTTTTSSTDCPLWTHTHTYKNTWDEDS